MAGKVGRLCGRRMVAEIAGSGHHRDAKRWSNRQRDHVLLQSLAQADARIIAARHDVGHAVLYAQFHLDAGVAAHEGRKHRPQHCIRRVLARRDPDGADRCPLSLRERRDLVVQPGQSRRQGGKEAFAGRSRGDAARRAGEQAETQLGLQPLHGLAKRRLRDSKPLRGLREAAVGGDRREDGEIAELVRTH